MTAKEFADHRPALDRMLAGMLDDEQAVISVHDHFVDECMYRA